MPAKSNLTARLLLATKYINDNLDKDLQTKEIAQVACISLYHFHRLFTFTFGITPARYIRVARLERAKILLHSGHRSVSEIAFLVGYSDIYSFSKIFKREVGLSPSDFARRSQLAALTT